MFFIKILNLFNEIPVLPNSGDGIYLEGAKVDQSEYPLLNSKRVIKTNIPKNLRVPLFVVGLFMSLVIFLVVNIKIKFNYTWGNINKNNQDVIKCHSCLTRMYLLLQWGD